MSLLNLNLFFWVDNPHTWLSLYALSSTMLIATLMYARLNSNAYFSDQLSYYMGIIPDNMRNSHNMEILKTACLWCFSSSKKSEVETLMNCSMCDFNSTDVHTNVSYVPVKDLQKAMGDHSNPGPSQEETLHATFAMAVSVMLYYSLNAFWKQVSILKESHDGTNKKRSRISPLAIDSSPDNSPGKFADLEESGRMYNDDGGDDGNVISRKLDFSGIS